MRSARPVGNCIWVKGRSQVNLDFFTHRETWGPPVVLVIGFDGTRGLARSDTVDLREPILGNPW